ncbi:hypothetical protein [Massilia horti]|uniref:Uncharacterized protein n=1 Tax=Massilia horti TaxID=2562153 RepID=A0A4Y9SN17_9BURK|nr:hypothetical protein [Massilia horti]TFW27938.1 hypothetical protein E4O92_22495 [Massilia horti]
MTIHAHVAHTVPGRVRLRLPEHRGDEELFGRLEQELLESGQFGAVSANPATASLVLEFTGTLKQALAVLADRFQMEVKPPPAAPPAARASAPFDPLRLVTGRDIDPMLVAGVAFGAIGVVQAFRGAILVPAMSAFWYAFNAFRLASEPNRRGAADEVEALAETVGEAAGEAGAD